MKKIKWLALSMCFFLIMASGCSKSDESKSIYEEVKKQHTDGRALMKSFTDEVQKVATGKSKSVKDLQETLKKLEDFVKASRTKTDKFKGESSQTAKDLLKRNSELLDLMEKRLVKKEFPKMISILDDPTTSPGEKNRQLFEWSKTLGPSPTEPRKLEEALKKLAQEIGAK
ncbi:MAG: hypothetical protein ACOYXC_10585 [Candidatus Rifleibacteriota bacterium]